MTMEYIVKLFNKCNNLISKGINPFQLLEVLLLKTEKSQSSVVFRLTRTLLNS